MTTWITVSVLLNLCEFIYGVLLHQQTFSFTGLIRNKKIKNSNVFHIIKPSGMLSCMKQCLCYADCQVMSYNSKQLECYLGNSETALDDYPGTEILTSLVRDIQINSFNVGYCASRQCNTGTKCITLTKGGMKCTQFKFAMEESTTSSMTTSLEVTTESPTTVLLTSTARPLETSTSFMTTSPDTTQSPTTVALTPTAQRCPISYIKMNNIDLCYKIYQVRKSTNAARQICVHDGGNLIMLNTDDIFNAARNIVRSTTRNARVIVDGQYNTRSRKVEYWTGEAMDTTKFSPGGSRPSSYWSCIYVNYLSHGFYFRAKTCSSGGYFMCGISL